MIADALHALKILPKINKQWIFQLSKNAVSDTDHGKVLIFTESSGSMSFFYIDLYSIM